MEEPKIPEIEECYVVYHPEHGYFKRWFESWSMWRFEYTYSLAEAFHFRNESDPKKTIQDLINGKWGDKYGNSVVRKVIICMD